MKFVIVDKNHNAEAITEVWPEGVEPLKGEMNQDAEFVAEKPGIYGIKCHPHYTMGMVALIIAGEPANVDQFKAFKAPGGAKKRWEELAAQVKQSTYLIGADGTPWMAPASRLPVPAALPRPASFYFAAMRRMSSARRPARSASSSACASSSRAFSAWR